MLLFLQFKYFLKKKEEKKKYDLIMRFRQEGFTDSRSEINKFVGIYGLVKYLYAYKNDNDIVLIDFNEIIGLLGFTLNFSF